MSLFKRPDSLKMSGSLGLEDQKNIKKTVDKHWKTCHIKQLPKYLQDNDYLHDQHRPPLSSYRQCFASIFRKHTETGNILTHLIGFLLFIVIAKTLFIINTFKPIDTLMLCVYFTGALVCHLLSTVYHVCKCHSQEVCQVFHRLDYCGISMQIICSMIPAFYYGFHHKYIQWFYVYSGSGLMFFTLALVISLRPKFGTPKYRPLRAVVFLTFGLSNIIPGIHWLMIAEPEFYYPFSLVIAQGVLYVIGAVIYAMRVPEKYFPGKCDLFPQSHQIFHTFVTIAAIVHFRSIYRMIYLRQTYF